MSSNPHEFIPCWLHEEAFAANLDARRAKLWMVRLVGHGRAEIDKLPIPPIIRVPGEEYTQDSVGFGDTLAEAAMEAKLAREAEAVREAAAARKSAERAAMRPRKWMCE